jgi:hypothetical protein
VRGEQVRRPAGALEPDDAGNRLGVGPGEIDDYPFLQALWDITALEVLKGRATMLDETARDIDEKMDAIDWDEVARRGEALLRRAGKDA